MQAASLDELDLPNVAGELEWVDANWRLDSGFDVGCDAGGWSYALEWFFLSRGHADERDLSNADNCFVRRRRWLRRLRRLTPEECAAVEAARVQEALALAAAARHEEALAAEAAEALRREEAVANRSAQALDTWLERQVASKEMKPRKDNKSSSAAAGPQSKRRSHREREQGGGSGANNTNATVVETSPIEVEVRLRPLSMHDTKLGVKLRYHSTAETVYLHQWLRSGAPAAEVAGGGASNEGLLQRGLQEFQKRHPRAPWVPGLGALLVQVNDAPLEGMSFQEIVDAIKFASAPENGGLRRVKLRQPPPSHPASSPLETAARLAAEVAADSNRSPRRLLGSSTAAGAGGASPDDKLLSTPPYTSRVKVAEVKSEAEAARRAERKAKKRAEKEAALARAGAESGPGAAAPTNRNVTSSSSGVEPTSPSVATAAEEDPVQAQARADARAAAKRASDAAAREREVAALVALVADSESNDGATNEFLASGSGVGAGGVVAGETTDVFDDQLILDEEDFCAANFGDTGAAAATAAAGVSATHRPTGTTDKKAAFSLTGWVKSRATAKVSSSGSTAAAGVAATTSSPDAEANGSSSSSWVGDGADAGHGTAINGDSYDDDDDDDGFSAAETAAALAASDAALGLSAQDAEFKQVPSGNPDLPEATSVSSSSSSGDGGSRSIELRPSDSGSGAVSLSPSATSPPRSFSAHASRGFASLAQSVLAPFSASNGGEVRSSDATDNSHSMHHHSSSKEINAGKSSISSANVLKLPCNFEAASSSEDEDGNEERKTASSSDTITTSPQPVRRSSNSSSLFGGLTSTISMMGLTISGASTSQESNSKPLSPPLSKDKATNSRRRSSKESAVPYFSDTTSLGERPPTPPLPDESPDNNEGDESSTRNGQADDKVRRHRPQSPPPSVSHAREGSKQTLRGGLKKPTGSSLASSDRSGSSQVSSAASAMLSKHEPLVRGRRAGLADSSRVRFNENYNMVREIERRPDQQAREVNSDNEDDEEEEEDDDEEGENETRRTYIRSRGEEEEEGGSGDDGEENEGRVYKGDRNFREDSMGGSSDESEELSEEDIGRVGSESDDDDGEEEGEDDEDSEDELMEGSALSTTAAYGRKGDSQSLSAPQVIAARPKGAGAVARHRRGVPTSTTTIAAAEAPPSSSVDAGKSEKGGKRHSKSKPKAGAFTAGVSSMCV